MEQVARRAPVALARTDHRGYVVSANDMFLTWARSHETDVAGTLVQDALGLDHAQYASALEVAELGSPVTVTRSGGVGPSRVLISASPLDGGDRVVSFVGVDRVLTDFDGLAAADAGLERAHLSVLLQAAVSFGNATSEEQLSELLVGVLGSVLGAEWVSVHLQRDGEFLTTGGLNPLAKNWPPAMPPPGTHTMGAAQVQVIESPEGAEALLPGVGMDIAMRASDVGAVIIAPIIDQGVPFGAVGSFFSQPRGFDAHVHELIMAVAQQSAAVFARLRVERELRRLAMLDQITGLPNRRLFERELERRRSWRSQSLAIVFIDLDGFKQVNDRLGHAAGDHLLAAVAERLRGIQRAQDAVCRLGGDEFIACFEGVDEEAAYDIAERIRVDLARPYESLPDGLAVTASVGVAVGSRAEFASVDQLIREADAAMYRAKRTGGDTVLSR